MRVYVGNRADRGFGGLVSVVVLANFDQNGIAGYVGANTLMEAAFARAFEIPLFLLQEPGPQSAQVELLAASTGCLNGNPLNLPTA